MPISTHISRYYNNLYQNLHNNYRNIIYRPAYLASRRTRNTRNCSLPANPFQNTILYVGQFNITGLVTTTKS